METAQRLNENAVYAAPKCLTEVELLKFENLGLRIDEAKRILLELKGKQDTLKHQVEARLGIDSIDDYLVNPETGAMRFRPRQNSDKVSD